jgi:hypothetical protein
MRTRQEIISELLTINEEVLSGVPDADINIMMTKLSILTTYLGSSAALVAEAGYLYNQTKKKAYLTLKTSSEANQQYYSPMLAKDFISSSCGEEFYAYELAQRINSAVVHSIDACRTNISAEKSLLQNLR